MDLELRCPSCKDYYQSPVYLPCSHSLCHACAVTAVQSTSTMTASEQTPSMFNTSFSSDLDQLSSTSDNDSGVIIHRHSFSSSSSSSISSSSRPSSLFLPPALPEISSSLSPIASSHPKHKAYSIYLQCPVCCKLICMDSSGVKSLPKNRLLADIVHRYHRGKSGEQSIAKCQLCRSSDEQPITRICEQCQIGYCDQCREDYHPMRGPYVTHHFIDPSEQVSHCKEQIFCSTHSSRSADFYCLHCRMECCQQCSSHLHHEIVSVHQATKSYKVGKC